MYRENYWDRTVIITIINFIDKLIVTQQIRIRNFTKMCYSCSMH
jgi:hypothetical protein